jgi:tripeptidyl-peptidase II
MQDPGPVYDIVLWRDSNGWAVVVDISETGDMSAVVPMREYGVAQEYRTFSALDSLNYGVQVYDEGMCSTSLILLACVSIDEQHKLAA